MNPSLKKTLNAVVGIVLLVLLVWFLVSHRQQIRRGVIDRDSIAYWAAAKLLINHQNPYSATDILELQQGEGFGTTKPLVLRTPPWSLWMVLPLGLLGAYGAWIAWITVSLIALLVSMRLTWRMYGNGLRPPSVFLVAGYLFAPVPACLVTGQLGLVLLLGISLFLLLEEQHPAWAGAVLVIPFAKPHIFALLWPILAVWIFQQKKWRMAAGFAAAFVALFGLAFMFDPGVVSHYREMLHSESIQYEFIPALSGVLRLLFLRPHFWAQFVPMLLGLCWSARFYWHKREHWSWKEHGPAVLVVSLLVTPYAWMTDETVLLPAILQAVLWVYAARQKFKSSSQLWLLLFACLDGLLLLLLRAKIPFSTGIYFWSSLVWFSFYWYAWKFRTRSAD